jgi:AraC family transcriptional regulator, dual regulator of chb operon
MLNLPWKTSYSKDHWCHLVFIPAKEIMLTEHVHEYNEVFVTLCPGLVHYINGRREVLGENTIMFIRPQDNHRFEVPRKIANKEIVMINVQIPNQVIEDLRERLFTERKEFWSGEHVFPESFIMTDTEAKKFMLDAQQLMRVIWNRFHVERFLLNLLFMYEMREEHFASNTPDWLKNACMEIKEPQNLRKGLDKLYSLCGKCREHISRQMKKSYGVSPVEFIARSRVDYAARLLTATNMELHEVAAKCGFNNLSYFFAVFKKYYNTTPRKYRQAARIDLA